MSYTASVSNATTSVMVTPTANQANATIQVNGTATASGSGATVSLNIGSNTITVMITAQDGSTNNTYTTIVTRARSSDATLSALTLSSGTLSPSFSSGTNSYTVLVATTASITLTPTVNQANATVLVNGAAASNPVSISLGTNIINVVVTAQSGSTNTYTVTVAAGSSDATLSALSVSNGILSPTFASGTSTYSCFIPNITSSTVTPVVNQGNATVKINGSSVTSGSPSSSITIADGLNMITIVVTAQNGSTTQTYTINAYSNHSIVTTFAGSTTAGSANGTGTNAQFNGPTGIAVDSSFNLYVTDRFWVRKITPSGVVSTFAGMTTSGSVNGTGTAASFGGVRGVALDGSGNVYVSDRSNNMIRMITPSGVVTTLAGSTTNGSADGSGTAASFYFPCALTVDSSGNVFIADSGNHTIRKITPSGVVSTFAGTAGTSGHADGTGTAATFNTPTGITIDANNNIYVADINTIRKITPSGVTSTVAGSATQGHADGSGAAASFWQPAGIAVDPSGNLYVADYKNGLIRSISPTGIVTTVAGVLWSGGHADGTGVAATFSEPECVTLDVTGNLYICDYLNNNMIRLMQ